MLHVPFNTFGWWFDNYNNALTYPASTSTMGEAITLKASGDLAGATRVVVATAAELTQDVYGIMLAVAPVNSATADRSAVIALDVDEGNASSYAEVITNLITGPSNVGAGINIYRPQMHYIPLRIKAGSNVGVRAATVSGSDVTGNFVLFGAWGQPSSPELVQSTGQKCETLGHTSGCVGTYLPYNATALQARVPGAWTSLGTTTFTWKACTIGLAVAGGTVTNEGLWVEVGHGNGTTITPILPKVNVSLTASETINRAPDWLPTLAQVPSGATVYARLRSSETTGANLTGGSNPSLVSIVAVGCG